ncbi:conserved hypothetical protein [Cupriavidus taiwanensis]|uniref:Uncharacterized protein n=1 Tax=Cupriavidus taiwanensis TaxID=164546 RepID=A0A375CQF8_9BURK|nr:conserved hypothetical protein [Cupriavidus taiwanensis]
MPSQPYWLAAAQGLDMLRSVAASLQVHFYPQVASPRATSAA